MPRTLDGGQVFIQGVRVKIPSPRHALAHRLGFLTEDRNEGGLVLGLSVRENVALPSLERRQRAGFVDQRIERQVVTSIAQDLSIRTPSLAQDVEYLSGGNRQKVVLAKWLVSGPDLLIFDEPTRGIDVGSQRGDLEL